ncbi:MAG: class I SAM-dependent methyltransferase [Hyphomicrobiales bacterium]|nr:class I SAM-dependent methyltransferase [Hyphomicrobiales bacterium]
MATRRTKAATLQERLIKAGKTRWLDVGSGNNLEQGFLRIDSLPRTRLSPHKRRGYIRCDILKLTAKDVARLGQFDVVRMQHVLEHFDFEDAGKVLRNCARLLKKGGMMLVTVPDLRVHIRRYLRGGYRTSGFRWWAHKRIPKDSPMSFYFSIFTHSMVHEQHRWCYDFEGLRYQLKACGAFRAIRYLDYKDPLASYSFTHNRPDEDVCVMAIKR